MLHSAAGRAGVGRSHRMNPMRGEYKVPGGKLVAVDVEVADGRIARAAVSGDFFLEPDDALEAIDAALLGMAQGATVAQLTGVVAGVLGADVTMVGFTPEAVAIAVRRALGHATRWEDHTFEIVHEGAESPAMHMALDQVLSLIHISEPTRLGMISYAVFCLKKKKK